ncbi:MAG: YARHG domain-containing protein [Cytophagales bacterium]
MNAIIKQINNLSVKKHWCRLIIYSTVLGMCLGCDFNKNENANEPSYTFETFGDEFARKLTSLDTSVLAKYLDTSIENKNYLIKLGMWNWNLNKNVSVSDLRFFSKNLFHSEYHGAEPARSSFVVLFGIKSKEFPFLIDSVKVTYDVDSLSPQQFKIVNLDVNEYLLRLLDQAKRRLNYELSYLKKIDKDSLSASDRMVYDRIQTIKGLADSVVFYTFYKEDTLFYLANGNWKLPAALNLSRDKVEPTGIFQMGLANQHGLVVPVKYDKIFTPGVSIANMVEVQLGNKKGFYNLLGKEIIKVKYDAIYPYKENVDVLAQVALNNKYGWIDLQGNDHFEKNSHPDSRLFQSPFQSGLALKWVAKFENTNVSLLYMANLRDMIENRRYYAMPYYSPSYLSDLNIANQFETLAETKSGLGTTDYQFSIDRIMDFTDDVLSFISKVHHMGLGVREDIDDVNFYLIQQNKKNNSNSKINLSANYIVNSDARGDFSYRFLNDTLLEVNGISGRWVSDYNNRFLPYYYFTKYNYYKITPYKTVEVLKINRMFPFTKLLKLDSSYFSGKYTLAAFYIVGEQYFRLTLHHLDQEGLDIMRNEIYADYGYKFKNAKWAQYFAATTWYRPLFDNVDDKLSEIDQYNIKFIKDYQQKMQGRVNEYTKTDTVRYCRECP